VRYLTDFADQAVVLPLVVAVAVALAAQGWRRGAAVWLFTVGATFATTLAAKLAFLSCAPLFGPLDIHSPSGHTAAATVVAGGLAVMLTRRQASIIPAALLAGAVIGVSRVALGAHSLPEVCIGAAIGLLGAATLMRLAGPPPPLRPLLLLGVIAAVALPLHGMRLPAEAAIRDTAASMTGFLPACRGTPDLDH
jgi:hypothetical protein